MFYVERNKYKDCWTEVVRSHVPIISCIAATIWLLPIPTYCIRVYPASRCVRFRLIVLRVVYFSNCRLVLIDRSYMRSHYYLYIKIFTNWIFIPMVFYRVQMWFFQKHYIKTAEIGYSLGNSTHWSSWVFSVIIVWW